MKLKPVTKKQRSIRRRWNYWEKKEPGISTEQLLERVATDCHCDAGKVCDAIIYMGNPDKHP